MSPCSLYPFCWQSVVEEPLNNDRQQRERGRQHEVEDGAPLVLGDEHLAHLGPEVPRPVHTGMGSQGRHKPLLVVTALPVHVQEDIGVPGFLLVRLLGGGP